MGKKPLQTKPMTEIIRLALNSAIIISVFKNPGLMEDICGPFTLPVYQKDYLISYIILVEVVRVGYKWFCNLLGRLPFLKMVPSFVSDLLISKYACILMLKFFLIFEDEHRKKFYLHSFILEIIIIGTTTLFDCLQK